MGIHVVGVTANCGNSTIGIDAAAQVVGLLGQSVSAVVVNCQEAHYKATKAALEAAMTLRARANYGLVDSGLMVTVTKPTERDAFLRRTGMCTFVLYDKNQISNAVLVEGQRPKEVRASGPNKGGFINTFSLRTIVGTTFQLRTVSGHLDSNKEESRRKDWMAIFKNNSFQATNWMSLVENTPDLVVAGYDANTRDVLKEDDEERRVNLWQQPALDVRIAPMVLAPLGNQLYSADNTYRVREMRGKGVVADASPKRKGYARAGSLDFVALQNNSEMEKGSVGFQEGLLNLQEEDVAEKDKGRPQRDHSVIASLATEVLTVSAFDKVKNHIVGQLSGCAPVLASQLGELTESEENKTLLLAVHQHYLSPNGKVFQALQAMDPSTPDDNVRPWFEWDSIQSLGLNWSILDTTTLQAVCKPTSSWLPSWFRTEAPNDGHDLKACLTAIETYKDMVKRHCMEPPAPQPGDDIIAAKKAVDVQLVLLKTGSSAPSRAVIDAFEVNLNKFHEDVMQVGRNITQAYKQNRAEPPAPGGPSLPTQGP